MKRQREKKNRMKKSEEILAERQRERPSGEGRGRQAGDGRPGLGSPQLQRGASGGDRAWGIVRTVRFVMQVTLPHNVIINVTNLGHVHMSGT